MFDYLKYVGLFYKTKKRLILKITDFKKFSFK